METACVFCKIASKEIPKDLLYEDDDFVAFHSTHPLAETHIVVIPKKHIHSIAGEKNIDPVLVGKLILTARAVAEKEGVHNYRLIFNNGSYVEIPHLHLHLMS